MKRRAFLKGAGASLAASTFTAPAHAESSGVTFLVIHGAWSAGWSWKKMHPLMTAAGHRFITPTCTGIGERAHLANAEVGLETHINDILGVLKYEDLHDVVLVGHSYGGMVATGVVDRATERIAKLIYLDAFAPTDGQALVDLVTPGMRQRMLEGAKAAGGWQVPSNPVPQDMAPEDLKWMESLRLPQPIRCFTTPLRLSKGDTKIPRSYVYCKRASATDTFRPFVQRAQREHWDYREIDANHYPHVMVPNALAEMLQSIVKV